MSAFVCCWVTLVPCTKDTRQWALNPSAHIEYFTVQLNGSSFIKYPTDDNLQDL